MSQKHRSNRKVTDEELIRLNNLGLSLKTIGKEVGVHPSTVKLRLDGLGIPAADTRRSFMEDIYATLGESQREWLSQQLNGSLSIKDLVTRLIKDAQLNDALGGQ